MLDRHVFLPHVRQGDGRLRSYGIVVKDDLELTGIPPIDQIDKKNKQQVAQIQKYLIDHDYLTQKMQKVVEDLRHRLLMIWRLIRYQIK